MASSTLSLGSAGYNPLDVLTKAKVVQTGSTSTVISAQVKGTSLDDIGLGNGSGNSTTSIISNVNNFEAALGGGNDALNIFGNAAGARIELDDHNSWTGGNDLLNISGDLLSGFGLGDRPQSSGFMPPSGPNETNQVNRIFAGYGNDTIRITGQASDAFIYLGDGNDSLVVTGAANNLIVKGDDGNDLIAFLNTATDTSVSGGEGNDSVIFAKTLSGTNPSQAFDAWPGSYGTVGDTGTENSSVFTNPSIDLGAGNDSLILGGGTTGGPVAINTGSGKDTVQLSGSFTSTQFILDGRNEYYAPTTGGDKITATPGSSFNNSSFISNNQQGDTLVFSNATTFASSLIDFGGGNDSIVFGKNSSIIQSTFDLGSGSDTLIFGSNTTFFDTQINLGSDTNADKIIFDAGFDKSQVSISGGATGDTLFIGTTAYTYNNIQSDFYNGSTWWKA